MLIVNRTSPSLFFKSLNTPFITPIFFSFYLPFYWVMKVDVHFKNDDVVRTDGIFECNTFGQWRIGDYQNLDLSRMQWITILRLLFEPDYKSTCWDSSKKWPQSHTLPHCLERLIFAKSRNFRSLNVQNSRFLIHSKSQPILAFIVSYLISSKIQASTLLQAPNHTSYSLPM